MMVAVRIGKTLAAAAGLMVVFYLFFYHIIPWLLKKEGLFANRELTILLAILSAMGAVGSAHFVGLSPALGAFLAGMLLAESPFAIQIRSDIDAIRTLFVVLFFTSIGMLLDLAWLSSHVHQVLPVVAAVLIIKAFIIATIMRMLRIDAQTAIAAGITLGQVGEFAFVLASAGRDSGVIGPDLFTGMVAVAMVSMFLAPYMIGFADPLAEKLLTWLSKRPPSAAVARNANPCKKVMIIGFGPAAGEVAQILVSLEVVPEIIELNPAALEKANRQGLIMHLGDATKADVLEHAGIHDAAVVVVTVPDSRTAATMIQTIRRLVPEVIIIARGRYHRHLSQLQKAGASLVVDEEQMVGQHLAQATVERLSESDLHGMVCRMIGKKPASDVAIVAVPSPAKTPPQAGPTA